MKYLKTYQLFESHLSYDDMDLDIFTNRYIVGRYFSSDEDAKKYLNDVLVNDKTKKVDDFLIVRDENDYSLKPYRIYPKPNETALKRKEASEYIKKYGILSTPDLRYITHPLYAYMKYKHIDKLKELGVKYRFDSIKNIELNGVLKRLMREYGGLGSVSIDSDYYLRLFSHPYHMDKNYILEIKNKISDFLKKFNTWLGTDFYIHKTYAEQTDESLAKGLLLKLDDSNYNSNTNMNFEKTYKSLAFSLKRGENEDEYLAIVEMESLEKPIMKKTNISESFSTKPQLVPLVEYYKTLSKKEDLIGLKVWDVIEEEFVYIKSIDNGILWCAVDIHSSDVKEYKIEDLKIEIE